MENKLGDFIIKQIEDKKVQRWIIPSDDLFVLCGNMGIIDDDDLMISVMEYLEENEIDVNFHSNQASGNYRRWNELEKIITLRKILNGTKSETQQMMEKVDSIKVPERPEWLEEYMDDDKEGVTPVKYEHHEEFARIREMIIQDLTDAVEREITPTMDELIQRYNEIENNNN